MSGTLAELTRTSVQRASSVRIRGQGLPPLTVLDHRLDAGGGLDLVVPESEATIAGLVPGCDERPVTGVAVDVCPVPLRERIRATVVIGGRLGRVAPQLAHQSLARYAVRHPSPDLTSETVQDDLVLLHLQPVALRISTGCGCHGSGTGEGERGTLVDLAAYSLASTDPLADVEAEWLSHLVAYHGPEMDELGQHAAGGVRSGGLVRPCAIDRYGISFRLEGEPRVAGACREVDVPFAQPVDCPCAAVEAVGALLRDIAAADGRG